ncbi:MAG: hypothetical protein KDC46_05810, partial [Thermoleophilia bacterium]|nr:hypothetical protein [Thermoleophilia bacterium]
MFTPSGILDSSWLRGPGTIAQKAAAAVRVANPELDPVVSRQARFRVSGTGPLSSRTVTPVTPGAAILAAQDGRAEQAVRNVLRLIEDQAGGPDRSANLAFNGVAFSDSADGLAANTYRAHLDDDPAFQRRIAGLDPASAQQQAAALGRQTRATTSDLLANVVTGWMNLGPVASDALLGRAGRAGEQQLADAIRIVTHESVHAADPEVTGMSADGDLGFQEALAEKRSTTLPQLQRSRSVLGLDEQVGDAALTTSI